MKKTPMPIDLLEALCNDETKPIWEREVLKKCLAKRKRRALKKDGSCNDRRRTG